MIQEWLTTRVILLLTQLCIWDVIRPFVVSSNKRLAECSHTFVVSTGMAHEKINFKTSLNLSGFLPEHCVFFINGDMHH